MTATATLLQDEIGLQDETGSSLDEVAKWLRFDSCKVEVRRIWLNGCNEFTGALRWLSPAESKVLNKLADCLDAGGITGKWNWQGLVRFTQLSITACRQIVRKLEEVGLIDQVERQVGRFLYRLRIDRLYVYDRNDDRQIKTRLTPAELTMRFEAKRQNQNRIYRETRGPGPNGGAGTYVMHSPVDKNGDKLGTNCEYPVDIFGDLSGWKLSFPYNSYYDLNDRQEDVETDSSLPAEEPRGDDQLKTSTKDFYNDFSQGKSDQDERPPIVAANNDDRPKLPAKNKQTGTRDRVHNLSERDREKAINAELQRVRKLQNDFGRSWRLLEHEWRKRMREHHGVMTTARWSPRQAKQLIARMGLEQARTLIGQIVPHWSPILRTHFAWMTCRPPPSTQTLASC